MQVVSVGQEMPLRVSLPEEGKVACRTQWTPPSLVPYATPMDPSSPTASHVVVVGQETSSRAPLGSDTMCSAHCTPPSVVPIATIAVPLGSEPTASQTSVDRHEMAL